MKKLFFISSAILLLFAASCSKDNDNEGTSKLPEPNAVDLGLSVKWASFNLGASKPQEFGDYYAWGETTPYYESMNPFVWKSGKEEGYYWPSYKFGTSDNLSKYNDNDGYFTLYSVDDAATANLGKKWRMPTYQEACELKEKCKWELASLGGVEGYKVSGKAEGYTDKWIFLPFSGVIDATSQMSTGKYTASWTASLGTNSNLAYYIGCAEEEGAFTNDVARYLGATIRPVSE